MYIRIDDCRNVTSHIFYEIEIYLAKTSLVVQLIYDIFK